jgi:hypothetical protein
MPPDRVDGVKVFSATSAAGRDALGDRITAWLHARGPSFVLLDRAVLQSSDRRFHCLSIVLFYRES